MNQVLRPGVWLLLWPILTEVGMGQTEIAFRRHLLNADSQFSAAAAMDIDGDGALDIVCGGWWYQSPTWTKHRLREVQQIRGRYDDYSNLPLDVDRDGDLDIVSVNYRSNSLYWCRNPGSQAVGQLWEQIVIDEPGPSETGRLVDIDGDGQLDVLPNGTKTFSGWYEFGPGQGRSSRMCRGSATHCPRNWWGMGLARAISMATVAWILSGHGVGQKLRRIHGPDVGCGMPNFNLPATAGCPSCATTWTRMATRTWCGAVGTILVCTGPNNAVRENQHSASRLRQMPNWSGNSSTLEGGLPTLSIRNWLRHTR